MSTVPAVLDALVAAAHFALSGTDVLVVDGQPLQLQEDMLVIGFAGNNDEPAVEATLTREQLAVRPDRESYDVVCLASSWRGDPDPKVVRDRAYELLGLFAAQLAGDPLLGGLVMSCRVASELLVQAHTSKGPVATVRFVVHVDASR